VVISIIGMLMALLLPAVQQAREAGRRNTCGNNIRQLSLAVSNFVSAKGTYPGYVEPLMLGSAPAGTAGNTVIYPASWIVPILSYLERTDIYDLYRNGAAWGSSAIVGWPPGGGVATDPPPVYLNVLVCPSTPPTETTANTTSVYVANSGMIDIQSAIYNGSATTPSPGATPADYQANGVFFNHWNPQQTTSSGQPVTVLGPATTTAGIIYNPGPIVTTSQDYITAHDGSSLTLMLSENNYAPWAQLHVTTSNGALAAICPPVYGIQSPHAGAAFWGPATLVGKPYGFGTEPQNCFVWWPDIQPNPLMKINSSLNSRIKATGYSINFTMTPSSNHPGGVNAAFCDSHVRFLSQDIDYTVYCLLMTPYGKMCNTPGMPNNAIDPPGSGSVSNLVQYYYPSGGGNNYAVLRNRLLDESQVGP